MDRPRSAPFPLPPAALLLLGAALVAHPANAGEPPALPAALDPEGWSSIRAAHETWRHRFECDDDGTHSARNPGQGWRMIFDGRGFTVVPRGSAWTWGLELEAPTGGPARAEGQKLIVPRDAGLEEWFVNDARGLEQGWTFHERSAGSNEGDPLRLVLKVRGGLEMEAAGRTARFGGGLLEYGGLRAWDATGRELEAAFSTEGGSLVVEVDAAGAAYPVTVDPVAQQAYLKASNVDDGDRFGASVAIDGDTVVVGAPGEASQANDDPDDDKASNAGAAYVFVREGPGPWTQRAYLKAPNAEEGDRFGEAVAVSGSLIAVGAPFEDGDAHHGPDDNTAPAAGAVYTFREASGAWVFQSYLKASNAEEGDRFGSALALHRSGLAVGAPGEDGNGAGGPSNNDAANAGAVFVLRFEDGTLWSEEGYLKGLLPEAGQQLGTSVALEDATLVAGSPLRDAANGAATVFVRSGGAWTEQALLRAFNGEADDFFGTSVALSGDRILVGAPGEDGNGVGGPATNPITDAGAAYVFERNGSGDWIARAYLISSHPNAQDRFGGSVALEGETAAVGVAAEDGNGTGAGNNSAMNAGAAFVFVRDELGVWRRRDYVKAANAGTFDLFGTSVAISSGRIVVGAPGETGDGSGPLSNGAPLAGAAYVFAVQGPLPSSLVITRPRPFEALPRGRRSRPQSLRLGNAGDATATGISVHVGGTARRDYRVALPASILPPWRMTTVRATFSPRAKGQRRATLTIRAANARARTVTLLGRGR